MIFGSVCSGIEAASVAWEQMGWRAAWLAEIDAFASAVLKHHWPEIPNLGDMTAIASKIKKCELQAPDVLVGGTPCQAFSVAGLRKGLSDSRGQLTLSYVELLNAIDAARHVRGELPAIAVWENVPGVLSSKDNAFGCFLAALAGEDEELQPSGKNGRTLVVCLDHKEQSRGESSTPNISEWPNAAAVCSLSQVLEKGLIPAKFFLSSTACAGILRRAEKRGKALPELLQVALARVASLEPTKPVADMSSR